MIRLDGYQQNSICDAIHMDKWGGVTHRPQQRPSMLVSSDRVGVRGNGISYPTLCAREEEEKEQKKDWKGSPVNLCLTPSLPFHCPSLLAPDSLLLYPSLFQIPSSSPNFFSFYNALYPLSKDFYFSLHVALASLIFVPSYWIHSSCFSWWFSVVFLYRLGFVFLLLFMICYKRWW